VRDPRQIKDTELRAIVKQVLKYRQHNKNPEKVVEAYCEVMHRTHREIDFVTRKPVKNLR